MWAQSARGHADSRLPPQTHAEPSLPFTFTAPGVIHLHRKVGHISSVLQTEKLRQSLPNMTDFPQRFHFSCFKIC